MYFLFEHVWTKLSCVECTVLSSILFCIRIKAFAGFLCVEYVKLEGVPQRRNRVYMIGVRQDLVAEETLHEFGCNVKRRILSFKTPPLNVVDFCKLTPQGLTDARLSTYSEVCDAIPSADDWRIYGVCVTNSLTLNKTMIDVSFMLSTCVAGALLLDTICCLKLRQRKTRTLEGLNSVLETKSSVLHQQCAAVRTRRITSSMLWTWRFPHHGNNVGCAGQGAPATIMYVFLSVTVFTYKLSYSVRSEPSSICLSQDLAGNACNGFWSLWVTLAGMLSSTELCPKDARLRAVKSRSSRKKAKTQKKSQRPGRTGTTGKTGRPGRQGNTGKRNYKARSSNKNGRASLILRTRKWFKQVFQDLVILEVGRTVM